MQGLRQAQLATQAEQEIVQGGVDFVDLCRAEIPEQVIEVGQRAGDILTLRPIHFLERLARVRVGYEQSAGRRDGPRGHGTNEKTK